MDILYGNPQCTCGKSHAPFASEVIVERGALARVPELLLRRGIKKVYLLADANTYAAAGEHTEALLAAAGIDVCRYVYGKSRVVPDEHAMGSAMMHFDATCDAVVGVGSGVINDIGKIVANCAAKPYMIVATAPSMDGYASASSSMEMDGLKISLPSKCAEMIVGDVDVLKNAPAHMLRAGLGDMLAKYVSICEWRAYHPLTGEYYCEEIAEVVRQALKKCTDNASGLMRREEAAVEAVFWGLVLSGVAMNAAGVSRPASGTEHYVSHAWDMRALAFGTPSDLHGIQCAVGTLMTVTLYEKLRELRPDAAAARAFAQRFDVAAWYAQMRPFLGKATDIMEEQERRERKYDLQKHAARLEKICASWETMLAIFEEELPSSTALRALMEEVGLPTSAKAFGIPDADLPMTFLCTKDIRDKYVLSRLAWDLGVIEQLADTLK